MDGILKLIVACWHTPPPFTGWVIIGKKAQVPAKIHKFTKNTAHMK